MLLKVKKSLCRSATASLSILGAIVTSTSSVCLADEGGTQGQIQVAEIKCVQVPARIDPEWINRAAALNGLSASEIEGISFHEENQEIDFSCIDGRVFSVSMDEITESPVPNLKYLE